MSNLESMEPECENGKKEGDGGLDRSVEKWYYGCKAKLWLSMDIIGITTEDLQAWRDRDKTSVCVCPRGISSLEAELRQNPRSHTKSDVCQTSDYKSNSAKASFKTQWTSIPQIHHWIQILYNCQTYKDKANIYIIVGESWRQRQLR